MNKHYLYQRIQITLIMKYFICLFFPTFLFSQVPITVSKGYNDDGFIDTLISYYADGSSFDANTKAVGCKRINLYWEPLEGIYGNNWYAYILDNRELVIVSEGKTKEVRALVLFNCENNKYVIYALSNFGYNIAEEEFRILVPDTVINLGRKIICQ